MKELWRINLPNDIGGDIITKFNFMVYGARMFDYLVGNHIDSIKEHIWKQGGTCVKIKTLI